MSTNQGGIKHEANTVHSIGSPSTADNVTSLSTSDRDRLKTAFSQGPQFKDQPKTTIDGQEYILTRSGYRAAYSAYVLNGKNLNYNEHFGGPVVRMDYNLNGPPVVGNPDDPVTPTDSPEAGSPNSTIVKSGLGPNVSTKGGAVQDASPESLPNKTTKHSPFEASQNIASGDIKAGGIKGKSLNSA